MVGQIVLVLATVATGLGAGLFYTFSCAVMPGLRLADDAVRVQTMQRINAAIQNGWFFLGFSGAPLLMAVSILLDALAGNWSRVAGEAGGLILFGAALVITFGVNIPLNLALDKADPAAPATAWRAFETRWVRWNTARTLTSAGGLAALVITLAAT
ncbi:DUF1772 domain-containing protein [Kutzneria sp. 744]|uniref:anthrone oxygenase family protein n=1 Tax=Kutzneria sp. (strain 744) TaxID=345341 RepID=UPI0005BAB155|nr:anthrone oxygenase family protein [Kutzneria sp. 744]